MSTVINVPEGWESNSISKIVKLNPESITTRYSEEFEIEYIDISSITNFHVTSTERYKLKNAPSRAKRIIKDDYIIFSTVRPYLRAISFIDFVGEKNNIVCSTGYAVIKTKEIVIQSKYLFYYTQQDLFINEVMRVAEGSNYPAISDREFKLLDIKYPKEIKEQQRIAEILSTFDKTIEASQKLIAKEKNIKKGLMHDLLTNGIDEEGKRRSPQTHRYKESELGLIPEGWEVEKLGDLVLDMKSGLSRKLSSQDIGLAVIRSNNITDKGMDYADIKYWYINDPQGADTQKYLLKENDILVNFINSIAQIGKVAKFKKLTNKNFIYTTNILKMSVNENIDSDYLLNCLKTNRYVTYIKSITKPAVNQASFTTQEFKLFKIAIPEIYEQKKIANILTTQDKKIETEEKNLAKLQELKKGLMGDLLSGKVRVKI